MYFTRISRRDAENGSSLKVVEGDVPHTVFRESELGKLGERERSPFKEATQKLRRVRIYGEIRLRNIRRKPRHE